MPKIKRLTGVSLLIFILQLSPNIVAADLAEAARLLNRNFTAFFEETAIFNEQQTFAQGTMKLKKGGLMRFEYSAPDEQLIVIGEEKIWVYDPVLHNVTIAKLADVDEIKALVFFQDSARLGEFFSLALEPKQEILKNMSGQKLLYLRTIDSHHPLEEVHIAYNFDNRDIEQIGVIDRNKQIRVFRFDDIRYPEDIEGDNFVFNLPPDVEIIEK